METTLNTFSIMFVCTGNMCRSPMAERLAWSLLARRLGPDVARFRVFSAGTGTRNGRAMTPEAAAVTSAYGADPNGFLSSELTPGHVAAADLVLTATRAHRSDVVTVDPVALRRSFTLTEFARTSSAVLASTPPTDLPFDPVERSRALVAAAARRRGTVRPSRPDEDDIPDPIGRPMEVYQSTGAVIAQAVDATISALVGVGVRH
ncbi:low molecular weight phosphatase family protein [Actinopolymorpha alba]|uniref:arsenate reductase/protein-tyrosine-phosphatase family protein n=1 Tax=Actinopolymorpha alba TaxID=533267 RepID=UPI0003A1D8E3|nr:low molecular weight phosphatase family protein [Actinopolymorpha alba]